MDDDKTTTLSKEEIDRIADRICSVWGRTTHYWWPLNGTRPNHAEAFQTEYFEQEFGYQPLRNILAARGVTVIAELSEDGGGRKISLNDFEPYYPFLETFWTTESLDWVIYASHESSITVAGEWLLPAVQAAWPNWRARIWTTPFYERPH